MFNLNLTNGSQFINISSNPGGFRGLSDCIIYIDEICVHKSQEEIL